MVFSIVTSWGGHNAKNRASIALTRGILAPKTCYWESRLPALISLIYITRINIYSLRGERAGLLVSETAPTCFLDPSVHPIREWNVKNAFFTNSCSNLAVDILNRRPKGAADGETLWIDNCPMWENFFGEKNGQIFLVSGSLNVNEPWQMYISKWIDQETRN